jgi:hypothetical protein
MKQEYQPFNHDIQLEDTVEFVEIIIIQPSYKKKKSEIHFYSGITI